MIRSELRMRKRTAVRALVLLVPLACAGCGIAVGAPGEPAPVRVPVPDSAARDPALSATVAMAVLDESNRIRAAAGSPGALTYDARLHRAAQDYANELARRGVLDHSSPTPGRRTMTKRIEAAGATWSRAAENLGQLPGPATDVPRRVIQLWLDSPGHRRSLLDPAWTHSGVGVAMDERGYYYVVQLYLVPRAVRE
jgi:uncharacterized protein YkwD